MGLSHVVSSIKKESIMNNKRTFALALALSLQLTNLALWSDSAEARTYRTGTSYSREYTVANQTLQTGRYDVAEKQLMEALKKNPNNTAARGALALAQAELFKLDAAEKNANQVLLKDPQNGMALAALGAIFRNRTASMDMTYRSQRNELLDQSARRLEEATQMGVKSPEVYNQLGETYRQQGRYTEAQQAFETALRYDSQFGEALVNQGVTRFMQGDTQGAKGIYQRAIRMNTKNHNAHYRLGEAYLKEGDTHQALKSLNTALSLSPNNGTILNKMAEANQQQGNIPAAIANYQKASFSNPGFMPSYLGLASIYDGRGDGELAMSTLRSALNINPKFNEARNQLGWLALTVDKPDQAMQYFRESLNNDPQDPAALQGLSQALMVVAQKTAADSQGIGSESDIVDAEQAIEEAIQKNPNDLRLRLAHLRIARLSGEPQASEADLQQILSRPATNDAERIIHGQAFFALGKYQESDNTFRSLIQQANGHPQKLFVIGDALKADGNLKMAREAYKAVPAGNIKAERALARIDAAESDSHKSLRLANALNRKGPLGIFSHRQKESSIDYYEEALQKNPRQPEARLALAKLYERFDHYNKAANSYQLYLGLVPEMPLDQRQSFQNKIQRLQAMAKQQPISSK